MKTHRFTILVWRDHGGLHHARWVEGDVEHVGTAATAREAVELVRKYLQWMIEEHPYMEPDLVDAQMVTVAAELRPQYRVDARVYPGEQSIRLPVPCVRGRRADGTGACYMPTLGLQFDFHEASSFKDLVLHTVRERHGNSTVADIARLLPPASMALEELSLRQPDVDVDPFDAPPKNPFTAILDSLPDDGGADLRVCWQRDAEVADLVVRLSKETAPLLILGEAGCGKSTVILDAVRRRRLKAREKGGQSRPVFRTSAARLISGMKYLGQWEERCEKIIEHIQEVGGILCVESLVDLITVGGSGPGDSIAAFLRPYLERNELRLVAEATPIELEACRRLLPSFADLFQVLRLPPFTRQQAIAILDRLADMLMKSHHVEADPAITSTVHRLFARFLPYQSFPGRCPAFMRETFDRARRDKQNRITVAHILSRFTQQTGLPELLLRDELPMIKDDLLARLQSRVIGQPAACEAAANIVLTFKAGLNDPQRPLGVLLFAGPTGVGKTELARSLADDLFGQGEQREKHDRLIRLDMSEYAGPFAAHRLMAGSDGTQGDLLKRVRRQPFCVVLLDEIEKADPKVFDLLLRVFDEGRITDAMGRTTWFSSSVIIMTSNLGAGRAGQFGFARAQSTDHEDVVLRFFRPEFFNRIDAIVPFDPLSPASIDLITRKELSQIANREGLVHRGIKLSWSDEVVAAMARRGFDDRYGARPLLRALEEMIVVPLSRFLLAESDLRHAELRLEMEEDVVRITQV